MTGPSVPGRPVTAGAVVGSLVPPPVAAHRRERSPARRPAAGLIRRPPPLPRVPTPRIPTSRAGAAVYGLAAVDCRGRVADRGVFAALGWVAATRLDFRETGGLLLVRAHPQGVFEMTGQGHLRLPAGVRRCLGLASGDRVLLAADPAGGLLVVHPPAALDAMVAGWQAWLADREPA